MDGAIGGFFGLERAGGGPEFHRNGLHLQSGRAALAAAVRALRARRVWLPWYICAAVPDTLTRCGVSISRYSLAAFNDIPDIELSARDCIIYVNYFGLCSQTADEVVRRYSARSTVIDASQAFYYRPNLTATLAAYSPRKFFGVPDGGYLTGDNLPAEPSSVDSGSSGRMDHLKLRPAGDLGGGFAAFQKAEASIASPHILAMSALTRSMLSAIDYDTAANRRSTNFAFLHNQLRDQNALSNILSVNSQDVPLCYPLMLNRPAADLRSRLAQALIFVPTYWPEISSAPPEAFVERRWQEQLLPLPCDQRYEPADLQRMVDIIRVR